MKSSAGEQGGKLHAVTCKHCKERSKVPLSTVAQLHQETLLLMSLAPADAQEPGWLCAPGGGTEEPFICSCRAGWWPARVWCLVPSTAAGRWEMYATHPSHPESKPAWEKAAATQPSPALQASCKAERTEREAGFPPSRPRGADAVSHFCTSFLFPLPSPHAGAHPCSSLLQGGGCGTADSCCWRDESPTRGLPAAPLRSLALLW